MTDLKSLLHDICAAPVAAAQAAHDARQGEIERLRAERDELVKALIGLLDNALLDRADRDGAAQNAIGKARAALAKAGR